MKRPIEPSAILLVDDEPLVTTALRRILESQGWTCLEATSAEKALAILAARPVDVVISDEAMPGMSGTELLSLVRRSFPETTRIVLTGQASLDTAVHAINDGQIYRFFLKPCDPFELVFAVRQALELKRLREENRVLASCVSRQKKELADLERQTPGITALRKDASGAVILDDDEGEGRSGTDG
jgi:DNA-binding NtrC family response regulator